MRDDTSISRDVLNDLLSAGKLPRPQCELSSDMPVGTKRSRRSSQQNGEESVLISPERTNTSSLSHDRKNTVQDASLSTLGPLHPSTDGLEYFNESQSSSASTLWQQSSSMAVPTGQRDAINDLGYPSELRDVDLIDRTFDQGTGSPGGDLAMLFADSVGTTSESSIEATTSFLFPDLDPQPALAGPSDTQDHDAGNNATQSYSTYPEELLGLDMLDIWTTVPASFE